MNKLIRVIVLSLALSPFAALAAGPVDLNTADAAALEQIKGIGPAKAAAIIKHREQNGPFASVDDLVQVPGIGEKSLQQIRDELRVSAAKKTDTRTK